MNTLTERTQKVQEQVRRLVAELLELRRKAAELGTELHDHQRMVGMLKERVAELERENEVLRKGRATGGGAADTGTKERIDELVHEIDQCLALLSEGK
jgi:predicted RNase H-like nuclease (RuvC/YqgF family)